MNKNNIQMLQDSLRILSKGSFIKNDKTVSLKLTKEEQTESIVILPDQVKYICENPTIERIFVMGRTGHFCFNEDSFSVARKVKQQHRDSKVLVLNFANPVHPGGGVRRGANAQEEDLCRKSSLLLALEDSSAKQYYDYNKSLLTNLGTDAIIITPNVEIIRDSQGMLLDETEVVSVMTCAAPMITHGMEGLSQTEYETLLYNRITGMLKVAANYGYKYLVLGAWGCGAFGNDAQLMAGIFHKALKNISYNNLPQESLFRQIYFAVLDRSESKYNYNAFCKYFDFNNFYKDEDDAETLNVLRNLKKKEKNLDRIKGSLWGGAIGDALGYPVEFLSEKSIQAKYGPEGITEYAIDSESGKALVSDDTQMTLFTANGILVGETRVCMRGIGGIPHHYVGNSYRDWLCTQQMTREQFEKKRQEGYFSISWLCDVSELYSQRAPGNTCISAIMSGESGTIENPINYSKGCGGVMRVAPLALHYDSMNREKLDMEGARIAALTHGHSLGYMPAALLTHILSEIVYSRNQAKELKTIVIEAMDAVHRLFENDPNIHRLDRLIALAVELAENDEPDVDNIHKLGRGFVAEETLAIAVYCSLKYQNDFSKAVIAAVNHRGDSDSTGAVTGNIVGALVGFDAIDDKWKDKLELAEILDEMALDLCHGCAMEEYGHYRDEIWITKYIDMRWPKVKFEIPDEKNLAEFIHSSGFVAMNDALRNGLI